MNDLSANALLDIAEAQFAFMRAALRNMPDDACTQ